MAPQTPRSIALLFAAVFSLFEALAFLVFAITENFEINYLIPLIAIAVNFVISFFLLQYFLYKFIVGKIKLVYKTIHDTVK
ncbi:MAG: hypothetical protein C0594_13625, partial [Marinilabiliales bacterium]